MIFWRRMSDSTSMFAVFGSVSDFCNNLVLEWRFYFHSIPLENGFVFPVCCMLHRPYAPHISFYLHDTILAWKLAMGMCLSVTWQYCVKMAKLMPLAHVKIKCCNLQLFSISMLLQPLTLARCTKLHIHNVHQPVAVALWSDFP